ncbi:MAG: hypothetical protein M3N08_08920 [Pseudomonadota bacterium]|nr:hypothetical protein [Pseudomonadota bacterium]
MTELNESLARMRKAASSLNASRTKTHVNESEEKAELGQEDLAAGRLTDIKDNPIYQIMQQTDRSGDEQIAAIAKFLTVQNDDYAAARKRFADFQIYFNDVQNEGLRLDVRGMEKLVSELKSAMKPEIEKIVNDVVAVQNGAGETKQLLEVMRTARLEGKTIEQMKAAIDLNDRIIEAIKGLGQDLARYERQESSRQSDLNTELDAKLESEKGFWNAAKRSLLGPDKEIAARIDEAQQALSAVHSSLETTKQTIAAKESERKVQLESGPLMILRSIDATENGFVDIIVESANQSIALINNARSTVQRLMKRSAYSKETAMEISDSISQAEVREAILEGAIQRVTKSAHEQSEAIKLKLEAQDNKLAAAAEDEKPLLNAERVGLAELQKTALAFEEDVKRSHANFTMATANSVEARTRSTNLYNLLLAQEDMLQQIASRALPETGRALRLGLESSVGMQTSELANSVSAVTQAAIETGKSSYADLAKTQDNIRAAQLKIMQDAIDALNTAQDNVVDAAEKTVKHSGERSTLTGGLVKATTGLRKLLEEYDDIRTRAADPAPTAATPASPIDVSSIGAGPSRPLKVPANEPGASTPKKVLGS